MCQCVIECAATGDCSTLSHALGIPTLIILKKSTGEVITSNGRGAAASDPEGKVC